MKIHLLAISIILLSLNSYSQDTINLLNGRQIIAKSIYLDTSKTILKFDINKKDRVIQKAVDRISIFSINYADGSQTMYYFQDSVIGYQLSVAGMNDYILGEREALKNYKAPWVTAGGFVLGAAGVIPLGFWDLLTPVVYGVGMGAIRVKTPHLENPKMADNKNFVNGYKVIATQKKIKNAIFGSLAGALAFVIADEIIVLVK